MLGRAPRIAVSLAVLALAACGRDFAPPPCTPAGDGCGAGTRCEVSTGICVPCDVDRDGYLYDAPTCALITDRRPDCDDTDPGVHPGAIAICGDGRRNACDPSVHDGLAALLPIGETSTFDLAIADVRLTALDDQRVAVGLTQGGASGAGVAHLAWASRGTDRHVLQLAAFPLDAPTDTHVVLTTDAALRGAFPFDARWVDLRWAGPGDPNAVALATYGTPSAGIHEHAGGYLRDLASGDVYPDVQSDDTGYAADTPAAAPMAMTGGGASFGGVPYPVRVTHERDGTGHGIAFLSSLPTAEVPDATSLVPLVDGYPPLEVRASDGAWALIASLDAGQLWTWNAAAHAATGRLVAPRPFEPAGATLAPLMTAPAFARVGNAERYVMAVAAEGEMWWATIDLAESPEISSVVYPVFSYLDSYPDVTRLAADHVPDHDLAVFARAHPTASSLRPDADAPFVTLAFVEPSADYVLWADSSYGGVAFAPNELHRAAPMSTAIADLHVTAIVGRDGAVNVVLAGLDINAYDGSAHVWASGVRICPTL